MNKVLVGLTAVVIAGLVLFGCSKGYEKKTVAGDLAITLSVDRYPLVKGDNTLNVKVAEASGKPVTDAAVSVRYFMPAMPGMPPMDFNTQAMLKGDQYAFAVNVPMEGGWKTEVSVVRPGKPAATATFNIDAR